MKSANCYKMFCAISIFLVLTSVAHASAGNWEILESLPQGTPISVKAKLRHLCTFERATDTTLVCSPKIYGPRYFTLLFARKEVRQVRLEHSDDTNALIGLATGGAIGFAVGASGYQVDAGSRVVGGALTGAIFGFVGRFMNRAFPITHREVIYQRR